MSRFSGTKGRRNRNSVFQLPDQGHEEAVCGGEPQATASGLDAYEITNSDKPFGHCAGDRAGPLAAFSCSSLSDFFNRRRGVAH